LLGNLDEATILAANSNFICQELDLQEFAVWQFGQGEDIGGRGSSAFPLKPSINFE